MQSAKRIPIYGCGKRTKFERREAAQTARSAAPEGKKVPANDANPREWEKMGFRAETQGRGGGGGETGDRKPETGNQGRVGSPSGPKIQARSAARREKGLPKGR
jgi:hypothetical protein